MAASSQSAATIPDFVATFISGCNRPTTDDTKTAKDILTQKAIDLTSKYVFQNAYGSGNAPKVGDDFLFLSISIDDATATSLMYELQRSIYASKRNVTIQLQVMRTVAGDMKTYYGDGYLAYGFIDKSGVDMNNLIHAYDTSNQQLLDSFTLQFYVLELPFNGVTPMQGMPDTSCPVATQAASTQAASTQAASTAAPVRTMGPSVIATSAAATTAPAPTLPAGEVLRILNNVSLPKLQLQSTDSSQISAYFRNGAHRFKSLSATTGSYGQLPSLTFDPSTITVSDGRFHGGITIIVRFNFWDTTASPWQRVFDFGNGENNDNWVLTETDTGKLRFGVRVKSQPELIVETDLVRSQICFAICRYDPTLSPPRLSLQLRNSDGDPASAKQSNLDQWGDVPAVTTTKNYIAKSNWPNDPLAKLDLYALYMRNDALTDTEVNNLIANIVAVSYKGPNYIHDENAENNGRYGPFSCTNDYDCAGVRTCSQFNWCGEGPDYTIPAGSHLTPPPGGPIVPTTQATTQAATTQAATAQAGTAMPPSVCKIVDEPSIVISPERMELDLCDPNKQWEIYSCKTDRILSYDAPNGNLILVDRKRTDVAVKFNFLYMQANGLFAVRNVDAYNKGGYKNFVYVDDILGNSYVWADNTPPESDVVLWFSIYSSGHGTDASGRVDVPWGIYVQSKLKILIEAKIVDCQSPACDVGREALKLNSRFFLRVKDGKVCVDRWYMGDGDPPHDFWWCIDTDFTPASPAMPAIGSMGCTIS